MICYAHHHESHNFQRNILKTARVPAELQTLQLPRNYSADKSETFPPCHAQNSFAFIKLAYTTFPAALIICFISSSCHPGLPSFPPSSLFSLIQVYQKC